MSKHNPKNERIKRRYAQFLKEVKGMSEMSLDKALSAISRFEQSTRHKGFEKFHIEQAVAFKAGLADEINQRTRAPLASGTITSVLKELVKFFRWLSQEQGYRKISASDAEYFSPSNRDANIARQAEPRPTPSLKQIRHVLDHMPADTVIQLRDRALLAFLALTGIRVGTVIGLKLRHVDLGGRCVRINARDVQSKFSKSMPVWFFPVGEEIEAMFINYVKHLRTNLLFSEDDPLFPATKLIIGAAGSFTPNGLTREHWSTAASVREIVNSAFEARTLPAYGPHSFRRTIARLGEQLCKTPEQFKAWSQNLGHEDVMTTFRSYGKVPLERQGELIVGLRKSVFA